jgi:hypothetical protein
MKTREIIQQLKSCESMCEAGRAATSYFLRVCRSDTSHIPRIGSFRLRDIRACYDDLECTYLIRIFAVFEMALREFWTSAMGRRSRPTARQFMDAVALRCSVPVDHLVRAHGVRESRNVLVHGGEGRSVALTEARSSLCRFLSSLPREW